MDAIKELEQIRRRRLFISAKEASDLLGVSKVTVLRYLRKGVIKGYKIEGRTFIDIGSVIEALRSRTVSGVTLSSGEQP